MDQIKELQQTLSYLHSEMNRIETMAGTLSTIEKEHYKKLMNFDHHALNNLAIEEQNAARQLGSIKQMCISMAQKVDELKQSLDNNNQPSLKGDVERDQIH